MITTEGIKMKMSMEDFREALKQEVGSIKFVFRQDTFNTILDSAIDTILNEVKKESAKVIS